MTPEGGSPGAVALLGGTFDPPHIGHLIVSQEVFEALPVERVVWLPCGAPPHKSASEVSPAALRLEMTRAATAGDPRLGVSDLEILREGVSYTVDTLRELGRSDPDTTIFLVIGVDQMKALHEWREPEEVARLSRLVVMTRGGEKPADHTPPVHVDYQTVPVTRVDVSSTAVRDRARAGATVRYLVPDGVRTVIEREGLYA